MSHNVLVAGVIFDDIDTLEKAVAELKADGKLNAMAQFHRDGFGMRGWAGRVSNVDCGISLPNEDYDIGFKKTPEGLKPFFESGFAPSGIVAEAGSEDINGDTCQIYRGAGQLGLLSQRYRLLQLERNARSNGLPSRRVIKDKGQIALEVIHTR